MLTVEDIKELIPQIALYNTQTNTMMFRKFSSWQTVTQSIDDFVSTLERKSKTEAAEKVLQDLKSRLYADKENFKQLEKFILFPTFIPAVGGTVNEGIIVSEDVQVYTEVTREPIDLDPYEIYLTTELARLIGLIDDDAAYDDAWEMGRESYKRYLKSEYAKTDVPAYDAISSFLRSLK